MAFALAIRLIFLYCKIFFVCNTVFVQEFVQYDVYSNSHLCMHIDALFFCSLEYFSGDLRCSANNTCEKLLLVYSTIQRNFFCAIMVGDRVFEDVVITVVVN